jgi:membrane fusion protein (multidrug efflux system)
VCGYLHGLFETTHIRIPMTFVKRTAVASTVAIGLAALAWWWPEPSDSATVVPARQGATDSRLGVRAIVVRPGVFQDRIFVTGTALAQDEVYLQAEANGRLISLSLTEGQMVRKGDRIAKINDADLQAQLRRAELNLELARIRESRQKQLLETKAISQQDYDIILNEVNTILAEIDLIRANIERTEIRAPFDGRLGLRLVSEGTFVTVGTRLASLQNLDQVRIDFSIPERYAAQVRSGDRITFTRQGSDRRYQAVVTAIEPRVDPNTRTLSLRATAPNPDEAILPGVFAQITYPLSRVANAILIPSEAIIPELGSVYVFVSRSGRAQRVAVETGVRTGTQIQILRGLSPGDTVLTTGILQLRQDLPVRVTATEDGTEP